MVSELLGTYLSKKQAIDLRLNNSQEFFKKRKEKYEKDIRELAKLYFGKLAEALNGREYLILVETDLLFRYLESDLPRHNESYYDDNRNAKDLRIWDFRTPYSVGPVGTVFERFPAIRKQVEDLQRLKPYLVLTYGGCRSGEVTAKEVQRSFLCQGNNKLWGNIEDVLLKTTFLKDGKDWHEKPIIKLGNEVVFPNQEFKNSIRTLCSWYEDCEKQGFDPYAVMVKENARTFTRVDDCSGRDPMYQ